MRSVICSRRLFLAAASAAAFALAAGMSGCSDAPQKGPASGPYSIIEVFDGDSFNLRAANGTIVRVRIAGIDAPEKTQPYSAKAKASLESLLTSGSITLRAIKQDTFERWIAHVDVDGRDVGLSQIAAGYAWFFKRYKNDLSAPLQERYTQAEEDARASRLGLWAGIAASSTNPALAPEPPWKFRERTKKGQPLR